MKLELAKLEQSQGIANLVNQAYRGEIGWTKERNLVSGNRISSKQVKDIILNNNSYLLILRDDTNITSCICIEKQNAFAYLGLFAVEPNIQTKGIGKKVLKLAEEYTKQTLQLNKVKIVVISQREELISFYERRGYIKTKII